MHFHILLRVALVLLLLIANSSFSAPENETSGSTEVSQHANDYLDSIRNDRPALQRVMNRLPKGGNLHHHLMGAIEPKEIIDIAIERGFCIYKSQRIAPCDCCAQSVKDYVSHEENRAALIKLLTLPESTDTLAVRDRHFFDYFPVVEGLFDGIDAHFVSFIRKKAAIDGLSYIESTIYWNEASGPGKLFALITHLPTPDPNNSKSLEDFRARLTSQPDFQTQLKAAAKEISNALKTSDDHLQCSLGSAQPACSVTVRFLHEIHRTNTLPHVYAQMIFAFELAQLSRSGKDPQILGINIDGPENNPTALDDYLSHMKMLSFLKNHKKYPLVKDNITLHAGELVQATAEDSYYRTTLAEAIQMVQPKRIGHGISLMAQNCLKQSGSDHHEEYVNCSTELLKTMLDKDIAVEVPFTSNRRLNDVGPDTHPFLIYLGHNIAVTLATDDPGILKIDLTSQFVEALYGFRHHHGDENPLSFDRVLELTRNSLEYSFLPGQSLWVKSKDHVRYQKRVQACLDLKSEACNKFVGNNLKARLQRTHELKLKEFLATDFQQAVSF